MIDAYLLAALAVANVIIALVAVWQMARAHYWRELAQNLELRLEVRTRDLAAARATGAKLSRHIEVQGLREMRAS